MAILPGNTVSYAQLKWPYFVQKYCTIQHCTRSLLNPQIVIKPWLDWSCQLKIAWAIGILQGIWWTRFYFDSLWCFWILPILGQKPVLFLQFTYIAETALPSDTMRYNALEPSTTANNVYFTCGDFKISRHCKIWERCIRGMFCMKWNVFARGWGDEMVGGLKSRNCEEF